MNRRERKKFKRWIIISALVGILSVGIFIYSHSQAIAAYYSDFTRPALPPPVIFNNEASLAVSSLPKNRIRVEKTIQVPVKKKIEPVVAPDQFPKEFNLNIPFVSQAPFANWDAVHEETCEEAAVLMAYLFYQNKTLSREEQEAELQRMVEVEKSLFGFFEDTDVAQTIIFAKQAFGFSSGRILERPVVNDLKRELFARRPVLMPAHGKKLRNPNFRNGGPPYHMIVLRGWNEKGFFTNDPGTRKGKGFFYTFDTIAKAMHDWDGKAAEGPARAFVLMP